MRWVCQVWIQLFEPALQPNHEPLPSICLLKWERSTSDIWENLQLGPKSQNPMGKRTMQIDCEENTNLCSLFFYYKLRRSHYLFAGTFCRVFSPAHRAEWLQNLKKTNKHCILKTSCFKDKKKLYLHFYWTGFCGCAAVSCRLGSPRKLSNQAFLARWCWTPFRCFFLLCMLSWKDRSQ